MVNIITHSSKNTQDMCDQRQNDDILNTSSVDDDINGVNYYRTIATEMNNVASQMYHDNKHTDALKTFNDALRTITWRIGDELKLYNLLGDAISTEMVKADLEEPLHCGASSFLSQMGKLDMYDIPGTASDDGPRFFSEAITFTDQAASSSSLRCQDGNRDVHDSIVILYNMGLVKLKHGQINSSRKIFDMALELFPSRLQGDALGTSIVFSAILNNIGCILYNEDLLDEALKQFQKAYEIAHDIMTKDESSRNIFCDSLNMDAPYKYVSTILSNMGRIHFALNNLEDAATQCVNVLNIRQSATYSCDDIEVLVAKYNLALLNHKMGRFDEALWYYQPLLVYALSNRDKVLSREVVSAHINVLLILSEKKEFGVYSVRINNALKKLQSIRHLSTDDHHYLLEELARVGTLLIEVREYDLALPFFLEQHRIEKALLCCIDPELAVTLNTIGELYQKLDRNEAALQCYNDALQLLPRGNQSRVFLSNQSIFATVMYNVGKLHCQQGTYGKGNEALTWAVDMQKKAVGEYHPNMAQLLYDVGLVQIEIGRVKRAMESFMESLLIRRMLYGNDHIAVAESLFSIGRIHHMRGEYDEALNVYYETLRVQKVVDDLNMKTAVIYQKIAQTHHERGELTLAFELYMEALSISRAVLGNESMYNAFILNIIGNICTELGDFNEAREAFHASDMIIQASSSQPNTTENCDELQLLSEVEFVVKNTAFESPTTAPAA